MSLTISTPAAAAFPAVNFHPHGHHRGAHADTGSAGAAAGLFVNLLQSLMQSAAARTNPADPT